MRFKEILASLGYLILLFSFSFLVPALGGLYYGEAPVYIYKAYLLPLIISAALGVILWYNSRDSVDNLRERDAYVVVGLGWIAVAALGALPYLFGGTLRSPLDAFFESMSGFTTTGASVLDFSTGDYIDIYPHSILLWRALTNWLGGMGIIVLGIVILARFMHGGIFLFKAEVAGASVTRLKPKLYQTARILWAVYGLFTGLCIALFMAAGMPGFDAVCTSFATLSSGGFTLHTDSLGYYANPGIEAVAVVFMFLGATNFVVHYMVLTGRFREASKDTEMRLFVLWLAGMSALVGAGLLLSGAENPLRTGLFHAVSAGTTTGFSTVTDMSGWPSLVHVLLLILMLAGATLGSTSGGLKISRFMVLAKNLRNGMAKAIHPRAVLSVKLGGKAVPESVVSRIQILFLTFTMVVVVSVLLLCASGISLVDSFSATASCIANCGLGIFSPGVGFNTLNPFAKAVLAVVMWMGRLEIFTALMVLAPSTYRK